MALYVRNLFSNSFIFYVYFPSQIQIIFHPIDLTAKSFCHHFLAENCRALFINTLFKYTKQTFGELLSNGRRALALVEAICDLGMLELWGGDGCEGGGGVQPSSGMSLMELVRGGDDCGGSDYGGGGLSF